MGHTKLRGSCFHLHIYEKLKAKSDVAADRILKRDKVRGLLYWEHIPVRIHNKFLKEMAGLGLIKLINKKNIKVLDLPKKSDWFD